MCPVANWGEAGWGGQYIYIYIFLTYLQQCREKNVKTYIIKKTKTGGYLCRSLCVYNMNNILAQVSFRKLLPAWVPLPGWRPQRTLDLYFASILGGGGAGGQGSSGSQSPYPQSGFCPLGFLPRLSCLKSSPWKVGLKNQATNQPSYYGF